MRKTGGRKFCRRKFLIFYIIEIIITFKCARAYFRKVPNIYDMVFGYANSEIFVWGPYQKVYLLKAKRKGKVVLMSVKKFKIDNVRENGVHVEALFGRRAGWLLSIERICGTCMGKMCKVGMVEAYLVG